MIYLDWIHFGENVYAGSENNLFWNFLILTVPLLAVVLTAKFGNRLYYKQKNDSDLVELDRIADVRMSLFHFLLRWRYGLMEQISYLASSIDQFDDGVKENPDPKNNKVLSVLGWAQPGIDADVLPTQIGRLSIDDVFKILVKKTDRKADRQKMLSELYSHCQLSTLIFEEMKSTNKNYRQQIEERIEKTDNLEREMETTIQNLIRNRINSPVDPSKIFTISRISDIQKNFNKEGRNLPNRFKHFIFPIFDLSKNPEDNESMELGILIPMATYYTDYYMKTHRVQQEYWSTLKFWKDGLNNTLPVIDNILNIEYPNVERYRITN